MDKTTIQVDSATLERLKALKQFERQTYSDILNNLIDNAEDETLTDEELEEIKIALDNVKKGKVKPIEQVAKELGVVLK